MRWLLVFEYFGRFGDRKEGRVNFFTHDGDFGGNLRLGYRTLLPETDLVLGGHWGTFPRKNSPITSIAKKGKRQGRAIASSKR